MVRRVRVEVGVSLIEYGSAWKGFLHVWMMSGWGYLSSAAHLKQKVLFGEDTGDASITGIF